MSTPFDPLLAGLTETSNIRRIVAWTALVSLYAAGVAGLDAMYEYRLIIITPTFHTLLGALLGLLLVFRTNTAYDRWWEGRKLWGQLVNECRNFAVKIETCVRAEPRDKGELANRLWAFSVALKQHLRGVARLAELPTFEGDPANPGHVPAYVVARIYDRLERWRQADQLGGFELLFLDRHAAALLDVCGGCERIRNTPIAPSYRRFIRHAIGIYLITLPWGLVDQFHWWLIPISALVGYLMIGVEVLAEDVEEPFGTGPDDLKLDELCDSIGRSVNEIVEP
jgi:ion channel-forming bestrophin family protein